MRRTAFVSALGLLGFSACGVWAASPEPTVPAAGHPVAALCGLPCSAPCGLAMMPGCCEHSPSCCDNVWAGFCEEQARARAYWSRLGSRRGALPVEMRGVSYTIVPDPAPTKAAVAVPTLPIAPDPTALPPVPNLPPAPQAEK